MLLVALMFRPAVCAAQQATGAAFLGVTPSPRSYALGMSNAVSSLGAESLGANPANLGLMTDRFEAFTAYASLMDGAQYQHLAAAFAPDYASVLSGIGVSVTRLQTGGIQGADASGNMTGASFGSSDMAVTLGGAFKPAPNLLLGVSLKAIQSELAGYKSNTARAADLGLTYTFPQFGRPISVGFSVTNLGEGLKYISQTDPLPMAADLGVALPLGPALAVVEVNRRVRERQTTVSSGLEVGLGPVSFRAGLLTQNNGANLAAKDQTGAARMLNGLSGGLGLKVGAVKFDYAISQQAVEFGTTQRVAFSVRWGGVRAAASMREQTWRRDPDSSDWMIRSMGSY